MYKTTYTNQELDRQMEFLEHKCERCMNHLCRGFACRTQNHTAIVAERTPTITPEQKKRYFDLVGA